MLCTQSIGFALKYFVTGLDTEGWYRRIENNGWRLASTRVSLLLYTRCAMYKLCSVQLENGLLMQDTVTSATKQTIFHHSKVIHVII